MAPDGTILPSSARRTRAFINQVFMTLDKSPKQRFDDAKNGRDLQLAKKQSTQAEALAAHQRVVNALRIGSKKSGQLAKDRFKAYHEGAQLPLSKKQTTQEEARAAHQRNLDAFAVGRQAGGQKTGGNTLQEKQWNGMYQKLVEYQKRHGTATVYAAGLPADHPDVKLQRWCKEQRYANEGHGTSVMTESRRQKLNEINFCWDVFEVGWQEQFKKLEKFKKKNGHVRVPKTNNLYIFIMHQRADYKKFVRGRKGPFVKHNHRIKLLEDIGIDLDPYNFL